MKILVGISGGVDSAYTAKLYLDRGDEVVGCILKMHEFSDISGAECVCRELGIKLVVIDATSPFDEEIKTYFRDEYLKGRTPNPCIVCNERVKFKLLYEYARENGFDKIATGHYAKVGKHADKEGAYFIECAADSQKDQSYMLYRLPNGILGMLELPLGTMTKDEVRKHTSNAGMSVAKAKDSQEICFLPDGGYPEYIESVVGKLPEGDFINDFGEPLGKHKGIIRYTVGQRKGLGIALGKRMFVSAIDPTQNTVTLSEELKGNRTVALSGVVLASGTDVSKFEGRKLKAKLRYTAPLIDVSVEILDGGRAVLYSESELKAAPGQSAVVYDEGRFILGGFIDS